MLRKIIHRLRLSNNEEIKLANRCLDRSYYNSCYPDVAQAGIDPLMHYTQFGWREGRNPSRQFNTLWYLQTVEGAAESGLSPLTHYFRAGTTFEGALVPPATLGLEWLEAAASNLAIPERAREYARDYIDIRNSRLFNTDYYLSSYMTSFQADNLDPVEHFILFGWKLGHNPCPDFHTDWYLTFNADVKISGLNPLIHFLKFGAKEGRATRPPRIAIEQTTIHTLKRKQLATFQDYLGYARINANTNYAERVHAIEQHLKQQFMPATEHISRGLQPFYSLSVGSSINQYFVSRERILHALTVYFFTYCKPNGAKVRIRLYGVLDTPRSITLIHDEVAEKDQIVDGRPYTIWPEKPIPIQNMVLLLNIAVLSLDKGSQITIAGRKPMFPALFQPRLADGESIAIALDFNNAPSKDSYKTFAFISGCPGDAFRYRCVHPAEALENCGYSVDVFQPHDLPYDRILKNYSIVVAHRVPDDEHFRDFVAKSRTTGTIIVYDVDDLVFSPESVEEIDAYKSMDESEKALYLNGLKRYNAAMSRCDYVTVSTEALQRVAKENFPNKSVTILRNKVSQAMVQFAHAADRRSADSTHVTLAYFSGTKTHSKDFATCTNALAWLLQAFPTTRLVIVGHLDTPTELLPFESRIEKVAFMPWADLPKVYARVDINLAPLEYDNKFTEAKSELKYLEAALLHVPTIACDLGAFRVAIRNGDDGLLCDDESDWKRNLGQLAKSKALRSSIGERAYQNVISTATTFSDPSALQNAWRAIADKAAKETSRFRIAFVARAPIAETGGGYKKIFILAKHLFDNGHDVRIHVEPIAHLANLSDSEIRAFCERHFNVDASMIRVGHNQIGPVDAAIATNWPTAPVVSDLHNAKFKAYFIQDYEPEFYEAKTAEYLDADRTYDAPLAFITIGNYLAQRLAPRQKWIRSIPFAIDQLFLQAGRERMASKKRPAGKGPLTILFFARPGIERRNFAAGAKALERLHRKFKDAIQIVLYGLDEPRDLGFEYVNAGKQTQEGLAELMAGADIHLSFSLTNISTVIYEAMACGCACVEADNESVRTMVENGVDCLLGDPQKGAYEALERLVREDSLRRQIADAGYRLAQGLTNQAMCESFEQHILNSCLVAQPVPAPLGTADQSTANWSAK